MIRQRPREPGSDAPAAAGRGRVGQDRRRRRRAAHRGAGRLPGCAHGADRGARRAARRGRARPARRADSCRARRRCSRNARSASRCSRTARRPRSAAGSPRDWTSGEIDIVVGTHALLYGDAPFTKLGLVVIDEQHRFGVEQRAVLKGLGNEPDVLVMTATPIPRHRGDARLRRPGPDRAARDAEGPQPGETAGDRPEPGRARRGVRAAAHARSRPATRRTSSARSSRARRRSRRRPRPRKPSASRPRSSPACASGCCTGRCRRRTRKPRWRRSAPARSTRSSRRP